MKPLALAAFAVIFFAVGASAMTPETAQFLRSIGVNPESADIVALDAEGPITTSYTGDLEEFSLDILASQKKKNGIAAFIATRTFIRKLKADFNSVSIPKTNYDALYLSSEERQLAGRKFVSGMTAKKG
ncbi:MAG: hypothetical protein HYV14_03715 [Elusimicrobia bacterium]|nr:hypothetical protein [Elusimicrobiota bacterium]